MTLLLTQYLQKKKYTASLPMQDKTKVFDSALRASNGLLGKPAETQNVFSLQSESVKEVESNIIMKENKDSQSSVTQIKKTSESMFQTLNDNKTDNQISNNSLKISIPVQDLLLKDEEFKHKDLAAHVVKVILFKWFLTRNNISKIVIIVRIKINKK